MEIAENIKTILSCIPHQPGVYRYYNEDKEIIYVGKAKDLYRRVNSYFQKDHDNRKTQQLVQNIRHIEYQVVDSEQDAFLLENNLIKQYQPHYNILLKDGKSYPSICITREPYPRIFKTRQINRRFGQYYGPYCFGNTVDLVLELIHKLYPIRTCNMPMSSDSVARGKHKVCLKYHLGNCCGICENRPESAQYMEWIEAARRIIRGDAAEIQKQLYDEMLELSSRFEYEKAQRVKEKYELLNQFCSKTVISNITIQELDVFGYDEDLDNVYVSMLHIHRGSITQGKTIEYRRQMEESREEMLAYGMKELRDQLGSATRDVVVPFLPTQYDENMRLQLAISGDKKRLLELAEKNVRQFKLDRLKQKDKLNPDQRAARILSELQQMVGLPNLPMWIDSFDNSNIQGQDAVAGCVVFRKAKPSKSDYKRFNIKTVIGPDDYASMREVVLRRYTHLLEDGHGEPGTLPDLIIADGGVGQMHAIQEVIENQLQLDIPVIGLKKDDKHRTQTLVYRDMEFTMPITSEVFRLMVQIQDEVHRFAITFHKLKRSKRQISSQLTDIQGVGEKTAELIIKHFGSLAAAGRAEKSEWEKLLGTRRGSAIYEQIQAKISR